MNNLLKVSKTFVKKNASTILTVVGSVGVAATAITAVQATPKAIRIIKECEEEKGEKLTKLEVINAAGPVYIPSVIIGVATIACVVGANILNKRQQAAMMSAYALLDKSYKEYKAKNIELYGEEADQNIRTEIAKENFNSTNVDPEDDGKVLFYDEFSQRYYRATTEYVLRVENTVNKILSDSYGVYLNEYYSRLGLEPVDYGEYLGWASNELYECTWSSWLDFYHQKVVMEDGLECTIVSFGFEPTFDFENYM